MNYIYQDKLESERLITRFLVPEDTDVWRHFFEEKEVVKFFPNFGLTTPKERAQNWIGRQLLRYKEKRFGLQALIDKETGEFIGQCGLLLQEVDGVEELELAYHVLYNHWGKGYATEAAKLFVDYATKNKLNPTVISIIDHRNINSQRVAQKAGLVPVKKGLWNDMDVIIYRKSL